MLKHTRLKVFRAFAFLKSATAFSLIKGGVEGIEIARIEMLLRDAKGVAEALIVHDLALT